MPCTGVLPKFIFKTTGILYNVGHMHCIDTVKEIFFSLIGKIEGLEVALDYPPGKGT